MKRKLLFFFDYKSPFSYLAKESIYNIEKKYNIDVEYLPLDFSKLVSWFDQKTRTKEEHWKIQYLYLDARRFANKRNPPLIIKGPLKTFDSTFSLLGGLFCLRKDVNIFKNYTDL
jgi:2-hydroxychromene-2-carboxylate isomerase